MTEGRLGLVAAALLLAGCGSSESSSAPGDDAGGTTDGSAAGEGSTGYDATLDGPAPGDASGDAPGEATAAGPCPQGMALVTTYCIDKWEAYVVELDAQGNEKPHSPFDVVDGLTVRAKTAPGVIPQGYISQVQATQACASAGKRLCSATEFRTACDGADAGNDYPYGGTTHIPGYCNEGKGSMVPIYYGNNPANWTYADFNDPRLNELDGGLAPTAKYTHCESPFGVFDCVGNLHEWGSDPADVNGHGRFRGGFYGDAEINGHGCLYVTSAHAPSYHDYSTGFRCCADAAGGG